MKRTLEPDALLNGLFGHVWTGGGFAVPVSVLALSFLLSGCDRPPSEPESGHSPYLGDTGHEALPLTGEILSSAPAIVEPNNLGLSGSRLWVQDSNGDPGLHALDVTSGDLLLSVGRSGDGPADFVRGNPWGELRALFPDTIGIWAFDFYLKRLARFEPRPPDDYEIQTVYLEGEPPVWHVALVDRDRIVGLSASDTARFWIFDGEGRAVDVRPGSLLGGDSLPVEPRISASTNPVAVCAREDGAGFVMAYYNAGRLEYYDRDARLAQIADVPFPSDPIFDTDEKTGEIQFWPSRKEYIDCTCTKDHTFALYTGGFEGPYEVWKDDLSGEFVHVFDWDGHFVGMFRLDHRAFSIAVDEDEQFLYTGSLIDGRIRRQRIPPTVFDGD